MTLAAKLRLAGDLLPADDPTERLLILAALTLEQASLALQLEPINEATYMDLVSLLEEGAK